MASKASLVNSVDQDFLSDNDDLNKQYSKLIEEEISKSNGSVFPPAELACPTRKWPIKKCKVDDLKKLRACIPHEFNDFYEEICSWPPTEAKVPDSDIEDDGQEED